jgi:hypothetical protein
MESPLTQLVQAVEEAENRYRSVDEMEFPLTIEGIGSTHVVAGDRGVGKWCSVRPASDTNTYLGVYLGDLLIEAAPYFDTKTNKLIIMQRRNPGLWVPDLNRVVWGLESWWNVLQTPDDLKQITDADIQGIWYVRALASLSELRPATDAEGPNETPSL